MSHQRWISFTNGSGETVPPFGVVQLDTASLIDGQVRITIQKPTIDSQKPFFINGRHQVTDEGMGLCTSDFPAFVMCNQSETVGDFISPVDGEWFAKSSGDFGIKIWQVLLESDSLVENLSQHIAFTDIPQGRLLVVQTTTSHAKGSSEDCNIMTGDTAGSETSSGQTLSCYNDFLDLDSGKTAFAAYIQNSWRLVSGEC